MSTIPARTRWFALAASSLVVAVLVAMLIAPDAAGVQVLGRWAQALGEGLGAVACALCARRLAGPARAAWALFATGLAIWALTDLAVGAWLLAGRPLDTPSVFDVTWLLFYVPMLGGLGLLYWRVRPERGWHGVIDAGLVSVGIGVFGWVLLISPGLDGAEGGAAGTIVNLMYPVLDLAGLGALLWVVVRRAGAVPVWLRWVAMAFAVTLTADIAYLTTALHGLPFAAALAAAGYAAGGLLWVVAARSRASAPPLPPSVSRDAPPAWAGAVPFACGLAVVGLIAANDGPLGLVVIGALALAVIRLLMTHRLNRVLIAERRAQAVELRLLVDEQSALRRVAESVASGAEPARVFALVAREVSDLFGADCGLVWRFDDGEAEAMGVAGDPNTPVGHRIAVTGDGAVPTVARSSRSAATSYAVRGDGGAVRHGVASPVTVGGELWGCVHIAVTRPRADLAPLGTGGAERLERFAGLVGVAIANAASRSAMEARALTDPLTGLANRRAFQDRLFTEWERARRHGEELALVMIDLDHFKKVNDVHGHPVGDRVLAELARRLRLAVRSHDVLARVGGEEFAWVLPAATSDDAVDAAERAREIVRSMPFPIAGMLTASFGVCGIGDASGPSELHQLADDALYAAKRSGRDRVVRYSPNLPAAPEVADHPMMPPIEQRQSVLGVIGLARAVDAKDPATRQHSGRVADLAVRLATALGWDTASCIALREAGEMHDVGKIAVPDGILLKPGPLTPEEYEIVKTHAAVSANIVADVLSPEQVAWVRHHHERMDGDGYPDGLAGDAIPEGARILAVADAVDVMIARRPYSEQRTPEEALEECRRCEGTQFDPEVVRALARLVAVGMVEPPPAVAVA